MSNRTKAEKVETCEIGWWLADVKGRFQAHLNAPEGRRLIAESPTISWRSLLRPGPTEPALEALQTLTTRLEEAGWQVADRSDEPWFGLVLSRPVAGRPGSGDSAVEETGLDQALLEELRDELAEAQHEARLERERRVDAEAEATALRVAAPRAAERRRYDWPPLSILYAAYAIAVAAAVLVGVAGFDSTYGAAVAALTVLALSIAVDSWLAARRRAAAKP